MTEPTFSIDPRNPHNSSAFDSQDSQLSEAIYTVFPLEAEDAVLHWGQQGIALSYRYDISTIINDVLCMVNALLGSKTGEWSVDWPSNTFAGHWHLKWSGDSLVVVAEWRQEFEASDYLQQNNTLRLQPGSFLQEWEKLLSTTCDNLVSCGYSIESLTNMSLLTDAIAAMKVYGISR